MKVKSQLEDAQLQNVTSDPSPGKKGLIQHNTTSGLTVVDDGSAIRTLVTTDNTQTLTNKTLGGLSFSTFSTGDIIYASASNTLSRLPAGSNGQFIKQAAGIPSWAANTVSFNYAAKTHANTGYTLLSTDDILLWTLTNGSNDTATLPAANAGVKKFTIKLAATTAGFNTLTLSRAGSDTITLADGTTGETSLVFYTGGETYELVSDGTSVWQVINHHTNTPWLTQTSSNGFAPNTTAFGTPYTVNQWTWRRVGDSMEVRGYFQGPSYTVNPAEIALPSGISVDVNKVSDTSGRISVGTWWSAVSGANNYGTSDFLGLVKILISAPTKFYLSRSGSGSEFDTTNASVFTNNTGFGLCFTIPVLNWKA